MTTNEFDQMHWRKGMKILVSFLGTEIETEIIQVDFEKREVLVRVTTIIMKRIEYDKIKLL